MKRLFVALVALAVGLAVLADYRFEVPQNRSVVEVNRDASITIRYAITFRNQGQPIDVIDVGLPDGQYDLKGVKADLDGAALTDIRPSSYLQYGVEVHLGERAIPAGSEGTLHLSAVARNRVFPDSKDSSYASLEFSPTWYGSQYTSGTTLLVCSFVFPEGVGPDDPRYHGTPFTSARVEQGRVIYTWDMPNASPSRQVTFGASFPAKVMERLAAVPKGPGPAARMAAALGQLILGALPCVFMAGFFGLFILVIVQSRRRRLKYLPPSIGMEGVEVRRGLTVPEVAVLMEEPVDKVMALLLFGMIRKNLLKVVGRAPLKLELVPGEAPAADYEQAFAKAVQDDGRISEKEAVAVLTDLIKRVQEKMKGFSRKKSVLYYREIMRKAWEQVGSQDYAQAFEWMLLDKEFGQQAAQRFGNNPMPLPVWWVPLYTGHTAGTAGGGVPAPSPVAAANTVVTGLEGFAHDLVNSVPGLATKVTQQTNPVPQSSGHASGGGCACACACAGCACACAGGGR
ncbi:MAG: hypothetical protein WBS54_16585 [Acidobacteriota bacterium]